MIFKELNILNFGLYKGEHIFNFITNGYKNNNIVLIIGQNGVGKSTIFEALQLCILGSFILGDRTSVNEYESYLLKRCHNKMNGSIKEAQTKIELVFDYINSGNKINYKIVRTWFNNKDCKEQVYIYENGEELHDLTLKEKNLFIRELIQPGFAKAIFFDGEKLQNLNDNTLLNQFISESCQSLFGLNLIQILQRDIDHYINKLLSDQKDSQNISEFKNLENEINSLVEQKEILDSKENKLKVEAELTNKEGISIDNEIAEKGRWVSDKIKTLDAKINSIDNEIINDKKSLIDIYNELGPFTIARNFCIDLQKRLIKESKIEKWKNAEEIINEKFNDLSDKFCESPVWSKLKTGITKANRIKLIEEIKKELFKNSDNATESSIIHVISDAERNKILGWIEIIINQLPKKINDLTNKIHKNEERHQSVINERATFSNENSIKTLLDQHQQIHQRLGAINNELLNINNKREELNRKINFYTTRKEAAYKKILNQDDIDRKLKLADKTRIVLQSYTERLLEKKLSKLEIVLLEKFNILCRKTNYFDKAFINRKTFNVSLHKGIHEIFQEHLSAGEKQLLALSMLWSLHSISNVSLPIIIDTPLARLDKNHRNTIVKELLPSISEQVIVLGTEIELNSEIIQQLLPKIRRVYNLKYDFKNQLTNVSESNIILKNKLEVEA